jgi:hypothetical protein
LKITRSIIEYRANSNTTMANNTNTNATQNTKTANNPQEVKPSGNSGGTKERRACILI